MIGCLVAPITIAAVPALADATEPAEVVIVGVTPVLGAGVPLDHVPSNVQTLTSREVEEDHAQTLTDVLDRELASLSLADTEGSPFQNDIAFRGFTASPVLGTPEGIAIYQNGVRINEPFGDIMLWDFVPVFALGKLQVIPGSNPVFGLNALGGAVTFQMKNGFDNPGASVDLSGGSFGRAKSVLEYGASFGDVAFYTGALASHDADWRKYSPSDLLQSFTDVALRKPGYSLGLSLTLAGSTLNGNAASPVDELAISRDAIFAIPDTERNRLVFIQGRGDTTLSNAVSLQGTYYYRHSEAKTYNGGASGFSPCTNDATILCNDSGPLLTLAGATIASSLGGTATTPVQTTISNEFGGAAQASFTSDILGHDNSAVAGVGFDEALSQFDNETLLGNIVPLEPSGISTTSFGIALGGDDYNTRLAATTRYYGAFATDTYGLTESLHATLSWRLNMAQQVLSDRFGDSLDGKNFYIRFNPSAGLTWQALDDLNIFGNYSESNRIPTPAELSCADPTQSCRFPLSFVSDPPLQQVVARSIEFGARGKVDGGIVWSADIYGTRNANDILFVSAGSQVGSGYFTNAGTTQRLGAEASLSGSWRRFDFHADYGFVDATFRSTMPILSVDNPGADANGNITVTPGDRLPGIPEHTVKLSVDFHVTSDWSVGTEALYSSSQYLRGDEANLQKPLAGHATLDLRTSYEVTPRIEVYAEAENILDSHYDSYGLYSDPTGNGAFPNFTNPRFYTPAAPFGVWAGVKVRL